MKIVCDTSSIIKLVKGDVIDCLGQLFDAVWIPTAVQEECRDPDSSAALAKDFFRVREVEHLLPIGGIGQGELEAISLAVEARISTVVTDDQRAATKALRAGCKPITTPQVLLLAKRAGHIPSVKAALDGMRAKGEGIEEEVYKATLADAGEQ